MSSADHRRRAARIVYGSAALSAAVLGAFASTVGWWPERALFLARASGWAALTALALALCVSPTARCLAWLGRPPSGGAAALRRALGITAGWLALAHGLWTFFAYLDGSWRAATYWPYLRAGLAALTVLLALLATSYPRLVRTLHVRLWKPLHRLAYVAAILVFQHLMLSPFAPRRIVLAVFGCLLAVELLRFLPRRSRSAQSA